MSLVIMEFHSLSMLASLYDKPLHVAAIQKAIYKRPISNLINYSFPGVQKEHVMVAYRHIGPPSRDDVAG